MADPDGTCQLFWHDRWVYWEQRFQFALTLGNLLLLVTMLSIISINRNILTSTADEFMPFPLIF